MPLYAGKYAICAFLQKMRNMLRSHDRYKPVSLSNPAHRFAYRHCIVFVLVVCNIISLVRCFTWDALPVVQHCGSEG